MAKKKVKKNTLFFTKRKKEKIKAHIKKDVNINTYNKYLWVFETILLVGAVEEFIEGKVVALDIDFNLNVILVMLLVGTAFTLAVRFTEPLFKKSVTLLVRIRESKALRVALHASILFGLFLLYSWVYFDTILLN